MTVNEVGAIQSVEVQVDITHTYIGDLRVELIAPSGELVVLHNKAGGSSDNLELTMSSDDAAILAPFIGLPIRGNWVLRVVDSASRDVGTIDAWSMKITYVG